MKFFSFFGFSLLSLFLFGCTTAPDTNTSLQNENPSSQKTIDAQSQTSDFKGNPSVIVFGGTYCSHCQKAIPVFKKQIWDSYKTQANIWVNVIDQKRFDVSEINQGFNPNLTFENIAQKECNYVPSWVVLNQDFKPVLSSCGTEKSMDDMENVLQSLL